jgi:hypothetical protein
MSEDAKARVLAAVDKARREGKRPPSVGFAFVLMKAAIEPPPPAPLAGSELLLNTLRALQALERQAESWQRPVLQ